MKKLALFTILLFAFALVLISCGSDKTEEATEHVHSFGEWEAVKVATCTEDGTAERSCSCGEKETKTIPATGHEIVLLEAKSATCTEDGSTAGSMCSKCGTFIEKPTVIPAAHSFDDGKVTKEATCEEDGSRVKTCSVCKETKEETITKLGHSMKTVTDKEATCTADGSKHQECTRCGKKTETETVKAKGHQWKSATCTDPKKCSVCGATEGAALGHTTSMGTCSRCGKNVEPKVNIPQTPITTKSGKNYMKITSIKIKKIEDLSNIGKIHFTCEFTAEYLTKGSSNNVIGFGYKVLDSEGFTVGTSGWFDYGADVGDKIKDTFIIAVEQPYSSEYTLEISDFN